MPNHTDAMNRIFATAEALKRAMGDLQFNDYRYEDDDTKKRYRELHEALERFVGNPQQKGLKMQTIPIKDHTFKDLSDIRHLCPCGLDIKTCKREDTGEVFQVGRILTGTGKGACLYPAGNEFAKKFCEVVFK